MNVIFTVASMAGGGAERVISILANSLAKEENKIAIIMTAGEQVDYQLEPQIEVYSTGGVTGGSMRKRLERIKKLRALFQEDKKAVIVSFGLGSNFYTAAAHIGLKNPLIISERNAPAACPHPHLRNLVFDCADRLVFQTEDAVKCFPVRLQKKGSVIPNPIVSEIVPAYTGNRNKKIVAVGRFEPQKNYPLLLNAFQLFHKEYPDYTLHLYGRGYLLEELQRMTEELGIKNHVVFEGFCKNVHEKIKDASMYVLSSDYEGISNALLEAMAVGLPVISTDCPIGGSKLCIQDGENGLLVPVKDTGKLAEAMCKLAANPNMAQQLGKEAVNVQQRFSEESIVDKWKNLLTELL